MAMNDICKAKKQMGAQPILDSYFTVDELAAQLGRSRRTLERWRAAKMGPPTTRIGKSVYYRISSVREWLSKQEGASSVERTG